MFEQNELLNTVDQLWLSMIHRQGEGKPINSKALLLALKARTLLARKINFRSACRARTDLRVSLELDRREVELKAIDIGMNAERAREVSLLLRQYT